MHGFWRVFIVILVCFTLTGCWDSAEIDQLAIATASGLDVANNADHPVINGYLQIAVPSALGTTSGGSPSSTTGSKDTFVLAKGTGPDVVSCLDDARRNLSRKLIMSHRRVTVVGEDFAKAGVHDLLDEITRNPISRLRTIILVGYHQSAKDILTLPYPLERLPQEAVIGFTRQSTKVEFTVKNFISDQAHGDPYTLGIEPVTFVNGAQESGFALRHIAVFRESRLVGWLGGDEFEGFLWLRGIMRDDLSSVQIPGLSGSISTKLLRTKMKRTVTWVNGGPKVVLRTELTDDIVKNGTRLDLNKPANVERVQTAISGHIESEMRAALDELQHQYKADPIGMMDDIYRRYPWWWHSVKANWRNAYSELPVELQVEVNVRRSGMITSTW